MAGDTTNTFSEILKKVNKLLAEGELMPDADLQLSTAIRDMLRAKVAQPLNDIAAQGLTNVPGPNGQPPAPLMASGPAGPPMGVPGVMPGNGRPPPNADELRRTLRRIA